MEQKYNGFWGRILRVDLTSKKIDVEEMPPDFYRTYFGGGAMAMHFLIKETPKGIDAFDPENRIVLMTSPITGTKISGQGRHTCASLSPLTGGLADSQSGGYWGAELKFAGLDGIVITGKSDELVILNIEDDHFELLPAEHLRGKDTGFAQEYVNGEYKGARFLQIGPAGENMARYACVTADLKNFHGRGGLGAVMGSKNLRGILVKGSNRKLKIHDEEGLAQIRSWFNSTLKDHPAITVHHELGTSKGMVPSSIGGLLPTYNFQDSSFEHIENISGEAMHERINGKSETCFSCGVACKRSIEGTDGKYTITRQYGGPEYESLGLLGSNLGVSDIFPVAALNQKCNALGLDTISAGGTLSWAVECYEKGLIDNEQTRGNVLDWNQPDLYLNLLDDIAYQRGFGEILSQGSKKAAEIVGNGTGKYAIQIKGQEPPNHEPRGKWGVGLGYAVSNTGADHLQAAHDPWFTKEGDPDREYGWVDLVDLNPVGVFQPVPSESLEADKVRMFYYLQQIWGFHDVIDLCIFVAVPEFKALSLNQIVSIVECVTGWKTSLFELMKAGERWITMGRAFNHMHGLTAKDDVLPERFFEPIREGTLKGHYINRESFENAKALYYEMMGWDKDSKPLKGKLNELNVGWIWEHINNEDQR